MNSGSLSKGALKKVNIVDTLDVWSYRHRKKNQPFVDQINGAMRDIQRDFPDVMDSVQTVSAATLGGADKRNTLGYYQPDFGGLAINDNYTNVKKMNATYDAGVADGLHPSRGKKSGTAAVTYHEAGHALTDMVAKKTGVSFEDAAANIVKAAYKTERLKGGTVRFAGRISRYAQQNYAECVAEAVCDYYCNGSNASSNSKAIVRQLDMYAREPLTNLT